MLSSKQLGQLNPLGLPTGPTMSMIASSMDSQGLYGSLWRGERGGGGGGIGAKLSSMRTCPGHALLEGS